MAHIGFSKSSSITLFIFHIFCILLSQPSHIFFTSKKPFPDYSLAFLFSQQCSSLIS